MVIVDENATFWFEQCAVGITAKDGKEQWVRYDSISSLQFARHRNRKLRLSFRVDGLSQKFRLATQGQRVIHELLERTMKAHPHIISLI